MSKLHTSTERLPKLSLALTTAVLLGAACTANSKPAPTPSPEEKTTPTTAAGSATLKLPSCAVKAVVDGRSATFSLQIENGEEFGVFGPDHATYNYGDGQTEVNASLYRQLHTYAKSGTFEATGWLVLSTSDPRSPLRVGNQVACTPATVMVP